MNPSRHASAFALATACLLTGIGLSQVYAIPDKTRAAQPRIDAADTIYTGGKIVAIGTRVDVEKAHKGANTLVVVLGGKALLPGFLDAHSHTISSWTIANQVNL